MMARVCDYSSGQELKDSEDTMAIVLFLVEILVQLLSPSGGVCARYCVSIAAGGITREWPRPEP